MPRLEVRPRNHRQLTPRGSSFGEFLFAAGVGAKSHFMKGLQVERIRSILACLAYKRKLIAVGFAVESERVHQSYLY